MRPISGFLAETVEEFLGRYNGFEYTVVEQHVKPTKWNDGHQILTVRFTCPTGEPRIEDES